MEKTLFYPCLWGILILSLLSSCRTEDNLASQKQTEDKRFATFTSKSGETINYANGFASLMIKYDELNKSNLSGIANKPVLSASSDKNSSNVTGSYIEFNVRSQVIKNSDGNVWVVFPKVENGNVTSLIVSLLSEKETKLSYYTIDKNDEFYKTNAPLFQEAYNRYKKRNMRLALSATASIQFMANNDCDNRPDERCREIEEVIITNPRPIKTPNKDITLPTGDQTDNSIPGSDCGSFGDCLGGGGGGGGTGTGTPQQDGCSKNKSITQGATFKENTKTLEGKTSEGSEFGYRMNLPIQNGKENQFLTSKAGSNQVDMSVFSNTYGLMHSHYDGLYPMFSPGDIIMFNNWVNYVYNNNQVQNPGTPIPKLDDIFLTVVTSEGTYMLRFDTSVTPTQLPNYSQKEFDNINKDYERRLNESITVGNVSGNVSYDMKGIEKSFLKFITDKMNMPGLKLVKVANEGSNEGNTEWNSQSGNFKENKCKQ